ncbi:MAG TPA: DUF433 domain-containing protein [Bryobacteraceae bacterium]|nr:DUF433 domain-containing protein [Bryobacteraceae bacterium]
MAKEYVETRNGGYYVAGARVSLDSIVYLYRDGASVESIQDDFPSLSLEQIHGAIAFYLAHPKAIDENISQGERELDVLVPSLKASNPELYARLERARQEQKRS